MDKRLIKLLNKITLPQEICMLDTYNQAIHTDCSCTITTKINTANHHFIMDNIEVIQVGNIVNDADINFKNPQRGRIYSQEGLSPCLCDGSGGGGREPKIVEGIKIKEATKQGYAEAEEGDSINLSNPHSTTRRGRVGKQIANTLDTGCQQGVVAKYRIRKLTPRECFRLMGLRDNEIDKIQASGISNSQQYKLAGNSIVVDNLYHIFRKMFVETNAEQNQQLTLF